MLIPEFWAEARLKQRRGRRQASIRRFGWSEHSQHEAEAMAAERAQAALAAAMRGEELTRRERAASYGEAGLPIREEVVARHGDCVITRNRYGARCLNAPQALFIDIDLHRRMPARWFVLGSLGFLLLSLALGRLLQSPLIWLVGTLLGVFAVGPLLARSLHRCIHTPTRLRAAAQARIDDFLQTRPDWRLALYRTPAGLRLLALHRRFDPGEPAVAECFKALAADSHYALLCARQQCFRARLTAKPWRMGMGALNHVIGRRVWPLPPELLGKREKWIAAYEQKARAYAACELLGLIGSGSSDPALLEVQHLHDSICQVGGSLPLA